MNHRPRGIDRVLTETTADGCATVVRAYTRPGSIRRAKAFIRRFKPFRDWVAEQPRTPEAREMHKLVLRELGAIVAGHRPDKITVTTRSGQAEGKSRTIVVCSVMGHRAGASGTVTDKESEENPCETLLD